MPALSTHLSSPLLSLCREKAVHSLQPLARIGFAAMLGLATVGSEATAAVPELNSASAQTPIMSSGHGASEQPGLGSDDAQAAMMSASAPIADGVYLYGQSQQANQLGSEYLVFEMHDRKFTGAFYMPQSSFDCVYGAVEAEQLVMTIVASYTQEQYPYALALEPGGAIASETPTVDTLQLEGFHKITAVSANDHRMVNTCKAAQPDQL